MEAVQHCVSCLPLGLQWYLRCQLSPVERINSDQLGLAISHLCYLNQHGSHVGPSESASDGSKGPLMRRQIREARTAAVLENSEKLSGRHRSLAVQRYFN